MPRNYVRKTSRGSWTIDQLRNAVSKVRDGTSIRSAAELFSIPYSTLRDRIAEETSAAPRFGTKPVFSRETEKEIADHCIKMADMFYGLTKMEIRKAVFDFAEKNHIPHRFNMDNKLAGKDWLEGFLKRNERISIRKPEATSLNRIRAFSKVEVSKFYRNLEEVLTKYDFQPDRIYNFDETGKNVVHKPKLIIAKKGMKRVGGATSGERGKNHTVACAVSAAGHYIPPMIIFPRVRMSANLMIDGPPGAVYKASKSGYITEELYLEWLIHFKEKTNASIENPVLLILDNHTTHCSVEAFDYCTVNGIVVLSLPPHTSHRLQPLDLTIFGPLNTAFNDACDARMKANGYMAITSEQLPSLLKIAWNKICSTEKAVSGFAAAGISPFNPNVFSNDEFYVEPESVGNEVEMADAEDPDPNDELSDDMLLGMEIADAEIEHFEYGDSTEEELVENGFVTVEPLLHQSSESFAKVAFSDIVPVPTVEHHMKSKRKPRAKQHSEILTSPEYKIVLDEKRQRRVLKEQKKQSNQQKKLENQLKKMQNQQDAAPAKKGGRPKKTDKPKSDGQSAGKSEVKSGRQSAGKSEVQGKRGVSRAAKKRALKTVHSIQGFEQFFSDNLPLVEATSDSN